jgi:DNA-binding SARP family transcriptional activator
MTTRLDTLGGLRVYQDGLELTSLPRRPIQCALLVYLAVERTATRDAVMTVLWPDKDLEKARGSLNNTAYELRMALGDDWIAAQGNSLQIREDIETDLSVLSSAVAEERFGDAVQVVSGGFLDGLHLARSTEFEQWVDRHRSRVKELERTAHRGLVQLHVQAGDVSKAVASARKWVNCVPYDDEAQYWLLRLLAESGRRADALKAHDKFRAALLGEFGVEPDEAVRELVERIRGGEIAGFSPPPQPSPARTAPRDISEPAPRDGHTPEEVWRPYPGWGKKLIKTLGVYLVPAYGLLQLLSLLIENGILPQELFRPALMLVLLGIPVVSATAFLQSHPVDLRARTGLQLWVTRWFTWRNTALGGVAAAAAYAAAVIALPPERPSWSNVPSSVVVLPFQLPASSEAEWALAVELVEDMTRELSSWESMNIASSIAVTGARLELGLTGPALRRANDGVDIARALESRAMIAGTMGDRGFDRAKP